MYVVARSDELRDFEVVTSVTDENEIKSLAQEECTLLSGPPWPFYLAWCLAGNLPTQAQGRLWRFPLFQAIL